MSQRDEGVAWLARGEERPVEQGINEDRRRFLRRGAMGAGAVWALSLGELSARAAHKHAPVVNGVSPYGPISPTIDQTTGLPLLQLPDGFRYWSHNWTGDALSDGVACPPLHDGMAVVDDWRPGDGDPVDDGADELSAHGDRGERKSGKIVLVRNHEGDVGPHYLAGRPEITYVSPGGASGAGGTTNLVFDTRSGEFLESWASLAGTVRNCAGGVTPWGSWLTCEETAAAGHGWVFDVGFRKGNTTPLVEMGRFSHEALMVDPESGIVHETEDSGNAGLYKFVPYRRGQLDQGGRLFMLAIRGKANLDLGAYHAIGTRWRVKWVPVDDPLAIGQSCYAQGAALGGARFSRLEGFTEGERLVGLTLHGEAFTFAMNNINLSSPYNASIPAGDYRQSEWAGACFSPDGKWLFVNIQTPGVTFAITGPWWSGPL